MSFGVKSHEVTRHEPMKCPVCGYADLTASTRLDGPKGSPTPGDYTICAECGEFLQYLLVAPPIVSAEILTLVRAEIPADMEPEQRQKIEAVQRFARRRRASLQ